MTLLILPAFSQYQIEGRILEPNGEAVIGANVYLNGTYDGASTDSEGYFSFETSEEGPLTLIVSYIGFNEMQIEISPTEIQGPLNLTMKEAITRMNEVVISAGSFEAGGESKREVLQPMDIVTTAGATADLAATLNTLPGTQTVGEQGRVFVRGGDGRETRTFIDGIAVLNEYSPSAPNTPSRSRFLPFMFKGVSFSTGGYSAEYGQALSSALILTSKDEVVTPRADFSIMSVGMDAAYTHTWNRSSATAKLQYTNLSPYFNLVPQSMEWVNAPASIEGSFAVRSRLKGDGMIKVYGNLNNSTFTFNERPIDNPDQRVPVDLVNNYQYINVSFKDYIGKEWFLKTGLSYSGNTDDIKISSNPFQRKSSTIHAKATLERDLNDRFSLRIGGEGYLPDVTDAIEDTISLSRSYSDHILAGYAEADIRFSSRAALRAGTRLEKVENQNRLYVVPRLSFAFKTGEFSQINAAYGQFYQVASLDHLMIDNGLEQERADHYMVNFQILRDGKSFRVEGYHKVYSNLVLFETSAVNNGGNGYARGVDIFWRDSRSVNNLDYWISYSYLDTERLYLDFPEAAAPSFTSNHNASIVTKYFVTPIRTQVGFTYSFASGRPYTNLNKGSFQGERTPAYHDLSANFSFLIKPNIILHGSVSNVLGTENIFGYEYTSEPNSEGIYNSRPIKLPAPRFAFLGLFITLSKDNSINQLPNL